jgi:hypothetical protein
MQAVIACWTTSGRWVNVRPAQPPHLAYDWEPTAACGRNYSHVHAMLDRAVRAMRRPPARAPDVVLVGDSQTRKFAEYLSSLHFSSRLYDSSFITPNVKATGAPHMEPWIGAVTDYDGLIVLNAGMWLGDANASTFLTVWRAALSAVTRQAPSALILARSTPRGQPNCFQHYAPVSAPLSLSAPPSLRIGNYTHKKWAPVDAHNALLGPFLAAEFPRVLYLPVHDSAALRPDCMVSSQGGNVTQVKEEGVFYDCTHYRPRSDVHRAWVQLLLNTVELISEAVSS